MKFLQNISIVLMGILVGISVDFAINRTKAGLELHLDLFPLPFFSERAFASIFFIKVEQSQRVFSFLSDHQENVRNRYAQLFHFMLNM
jgi:hypothetical protein